MSQKTEEHAATDKRRRWLYLVVPTLIWLPLLKLILLWQKSDLSGLAFVEGLVPDLAVALIVAAVALLLAGLLRLPGRVVASLWLAGIALLSSLSFGLLLKKGSLLDWDLLLYSLPRLGELLPLLRSEFHAIDSLLFLAPGIILFLAIWRDPGLRLARASILAGLGFAALLAVELVPLGSTTVARNPLLGPLLRLASDDDGGVRPLEILPEPDAIYAPWSQIPEDGPRPNFIVIAMESVRKSVTTPYPPHFPTTPFFAKLAKEGLLVDNAHCLIPHTSKSLLSIFTGYPPHLKLGVEGRWQLPRPGIPALLGKLGYRSAFFEPATERFEGRRLLIESLGFETYRSAEDNAQGFEKTHYFGFEDRCLVDPVVAWVKEGKKQPFFLGMINLSTHHDYVTPKSYERRSFDVADPPPRAKRFQQYLNSVHYFDGVLKELFDKLRAAGALENTVVILTGDHGEAFDEHGQDGHLDVIWDEALEIPMVLWGPERYLGKPRRILGHRQNLDIAPTIADILRVPGQWEYRSPALGMSLLAPPRDDRRLFVSSWYQGGDMGLLEASLKYIYYPLHDKLTLYDLAKDPFERKNLGKSIPSNTRREIIDRMLGFRAGVNSWYLAAKAEEIERIRVDEVPRLDPPPNSGLGPKATILGVRMPSFVYEPCYFRLDFALRVTGNCKAPFRVFATREGTTHSITSIPGIDRFSPERWQAGDILHFKQMLHISSKEPGDYQIQLALGNGKAVAIGRIELRAR